MPQRVKCDGCGAILYEGDELRAPFEIIATFDGKCSRCGKKLSPIPLKAEVKASKLKARSS